MIEDSNPSGQDPYFLLGGGDMGARMRAFDWSTSPVAPPSAWPTSLRTAVSLMLGSLYPMFIAWGPKLAFLYNDAYRPIFGAKHPHTLGQPFESVWPEIWSDIQPLVKRALDGEATFNENLHLVMERNGFPEDTWYTFSYSPIRDESGDVVGMFCACQETTGQVLVERRLVAEQERQRALFECAPGFIIIHRGPDHVIEFANAASIRLAGRDSFVGRPVREVFGDLEGQGLFELLDQVYATGERFIAEHIAVRLQPSEDAPARDVYLDFIYEPIRDEGGTVTGIFVEGHDVTESHLAQERLRENAAYLEAVLDAVPAAIWIARDVDASRIDGNDFARRLLKVPVGANQSKTASSADESPRGFRVLDRHGVEVPDVDLPVQRAARGETIVDYEEEVVFDDGTSVYLTGNARPLLDHNGNAIGAVATFVDITRSRDAAIALRESEAALRDGESRFRAMAEAMPGFVWTADAQGSLDYTSPRWSEYSGDVGGDGLGAGWADFVHDDDKPRAFAAWQAALETLQRYEVEFRLRSREGLYRWWLVRAMPVADPGRTVRWIGSATDMHEIVEARNLLARSQIELEHRVAERSAELMQTQDALRQSQKLEAMGQLTGGVAHDFNNLLTPIVGTLDVLHRRGVGGEREQRLIDGALQSSERARILVQRLLAFARRQPLQSQAVDVDALVRGMADLIASTSGPGIKVVVDIDPDMQAAQADANQVEMAVLNLSVNARDAMPDGGQLTISAGDEVVTGPHRAGLRPGDYVRISVADTGTGMDEATVARAIEPFYSTKGVGQGTGLGLSMVHGLASQLGGSLLISSKVGLGTQIEFWLPATVHGPASVDRPEPATVSEGTARGTILLVDDEDLVRLSTADLLSEIGFRVIETASAEEALAVLRDGANISAVVTDHLMPGMTGVDLARIIRENWPRTPVLLVSGYAEGEGVAPDLPRLSKPFRKAELTGSLASLLEDQS